MQITKIYQKFVQFNGELQDQRLVITAKTESMEAAKKLLLDDLRIEFFINGKPITDLIGILISKSGVVAELVSNTDWTIISEVKTYEKEAAHA